MPRPHLRHLRRCRLLFMLALCAWLGLAGAVFAQADCCMGMAGMAGAATMTHHDGVTMPLHADGAQAGCACAHMTATTLPVLAAPAWPVRFAVIAWPAWSSAAPELRYAPPLRPPLA